MTFPAQIEQYLKDHLPAYLDLLQQMVVINSFTSNPQGVNRLGELTAQIFSELGFQAETLPSVDPAFGRHLILTRQGNQTAGTIGMISHLDTVFSPEEEIAHDFAWRVQDNRIYGPGTVDIKGGTVMMIMILDALRVYAPQVFEGATWMLFLDASEERLSEDFGEICRMRLPADALACLVFEGGTNADKVLPLVTARKGRASFQVSVEGKSAHAGNFHANGANAILQISHTIQKIADLTDYRKAITFNVGSVVGGSVINRVPHTAQAHVEMRAFDQDVYNQGIAAMLALDGTSEVVSADGFRCRVRVEVKDRTAPWPPNLASQRLFWIWEGVARTLKMRLAQEARGGLSDGNFLWDRVPTLDGLGPAGNNAHCSERSPDGSKDQEYVLQGSFVPKALLNTLAILRLAEGKSVG